MTDYKLYLNIAPCGLETQGLEGPLAPSPENSQVGFHPNTILAKRQGLIDKKRCLRRNTRSTIKY